MLYFKSNYSSIATVLFIVAIVVAHIYSTNNYNWTKHTISHLGSQGYSQKYIMQFGFLTFGIVLVAGIALQSFSWRMLPILVYAICVGLTGIFCAKPFFQVQHYSVFQANMHSLLAQIAGIAFTVGIVVEIYFSKNNNQKWIHVVFLLLVMASSALFGLLKNHQGIAQRILYLVSFFWLIKFYKPYHQ